MLTAFSPEEAICAVEDPHFRLHFNMPSVSPSPASSSQISVKPASSNLTAKHHLIFFITGNPGLIGYYNTFLTTVRNLLSSPPNSSCVFQIYGQSLAGFSSDLASRQAPYSLEEQITILLSSLTILRHETAPFTSIILIGHSVGAYILLELISRLKKSPEPHINIRGGILLFPTVTHIAASKSGLKLTALLRIPDFPRTAGKLAENFLWLLPRGAVKWLVGMVTGMPDESAEVTTGFLKSDRGIWQALYLARDEMRTITEDKWDEDIWGVEHASPEGKKRKIPRLVFYFGKDDHWVADHTRDALIAARAIGEGEAQTSKPIMMIDEMGVDHGFCIRKCRRWCFGREVLMNTDHSESIAEKCAVWIKDMMTEDKGL